MHRIVSLISMHRIVTLIVDTILEKIKLKIFAKITFKEMSHLHRYILREFQWGSICLACSAKLF